MTYLSNVVEGFDYGLEKAIEFFEDDETTVVKCTNIAHIHTK